MGAQRDILSNRGVNRRQEDINPCMAACGWPTLFQDKVIRRNDDLFWSLLPQVFNISGNRELPAVRRNRSDATAQRRQRI